MAYDIPPRFHKVSLRHLREIERTKMCGRRIIIIIIIIIIRTRNDMIWRIINGSQFQKRWRLSIRKSIYLETKFCPNRRIFVFWWPFWIQNVHHSKSKWSPYGAACLTPCKYPFPLFRYIFEFFTIYFNFILAAILKILETKSTTLSDDLFLCQVSKGSTVRSEFNIFCTLVTMATATTLNFFNPSKAATHYSGYSYKVSWSLMKGIQFFF